jgi:hypothetical protein
MTATRCSIARGEVPTEEKCEHLFVTYADALVWLYELHDRGDPRYRHAAARWHAQFVLAARLPIGESQLVMNMLAGCSGANRLMMRRRLLERVEQEGLTRTEIARNGA